MFASLKMVFVFIALGAPAAIVGIPLSAIRGDFTVMYRWAMFIIKAGVKAAGVKVKIVGLENIPAGESCIFVSNHISNLDPPVLIPAMPGMVSVFLKKSLMKIPLLGTAMRMAKYIPVSRGHEKEEARKSVEYAASVLRDGLHIMLFPEGTRSPDGKLLPFKKGGFYLAADTGAPMVPVVIRGTAEMMPKGTLKFVKVGTAVVEFLPAVRPGDYASKEELMAAVRGEMEVALGRDPAYLLRG
jgi:1-acyl-sn-glycerol-3-phosphate acyltransferase